MDYEQLDKLDEEQKIKVAIEIAKQIQMGKGIMKKNAIAIVSPLLVVMYFNPLSIDTMVYAGLIITWFIGYKAYGIYQLYQLMDRLGFEIEER